MLATLIPSDNSVLHPPAKCLTASTGVPHVRAFSTDRFSGCADIFAGTTEEFIAEGTANILLNRFVPFWGCLSILMSGNGLQFCAQLATALYKLRGVHKHTSADHPSSNGGVERVNYSMAQMLDMVCNKHQIDWDVHLPHLERQQHLRQRFHRPCPQSS